MKLIQALRNLSEKLNAEFADSKLFDHSGEKGEFREQIISDLLRPFLPESYGLGSGQIFDNKDNSSNQIDVVLYDSVYSNVLFKNKRNNLFPCESVYGEIEIKSNLTTDELFTSIDNISSMKKLSREDSSMLDITPIYKLNVGDEFGYSTNRLNPYLGIIYAYDGLTKETFKEKLMEKVTSIDKQFTPDFIFNQKRKYMALKIRDNTISGLGKDYDRYEVIDTKEDTLTLMFLTLNTCLNQIRLKAPNYGNYFSKVIQEVISRK